MSFDYSKSQETARRLIDKFGKDVTHLKVTQGAYDPVNGANTNTEQSYTIKAVNLPVSMSKSAELSERLRAEGVQFKDLTFCYVAGVNLDADIERLDYVVIDPKKWIVETVSRLNPNDGAAILYAVALRS